MARYRTSRFVAPMAVCAGLAVASSSVGAVPTYGPSWGRFHVHFPSQPKAVILETSPVKEVAYVLNYPISALHSSPTTTSEVPLPPAYYVYVVQEKTAMVALEVVGFARLDPYRKAVVIDGHQATVAIGKEALISGQNATTDASATVGVLVLAVGRDLYAAFSVTSSPLSARAFQDSFVPG